MGVLLQEGIGDTIRISLTPEPGGDRTREVQVGQELLQTMGFRTLRGPGIAADFKALVIDYIEQRYGAGAPVVTAAE